MALCTVSANCGSGGTCTNGVCSCAAGRIGANCELADTTQKLGNVVVTQAGLAAFPLVYADFIQQTFLQVKADALANSAYGPYCTTATDGSGDDYWVQIFPVTDQMLTSSLDTSSVALTIISGGVSFTASANVAIAGMRMTSLVGSTSYGSSCSQGQSNGNAICHITSPLSLGQLCLWHCDATYNHDTVSLNFRITVTGNVLLSYSSTLQGLQASVQGVQVSFNSQDLGFSDAGCTSRSHLSIIQGYITSGVASGKQLLASMVTTSVQNKIAAIAQAKAAQYQGWQQYSPSTGITVLYIVKSFTVATAAPSLTTSIVVGVEGKVQSTIFYDQPSSCWKNVTYADTQSDALLNPPVLWTSAASKYLPSSNQAPLLAGARMTRSFMNGLVWADFTQTVRRTNQFTYTNGQLALSATASWTSPNVSIPTTADRIQASLSGSVMGSCQPTHAGTVLSFDYQNLQAAFTMRYTETPNLTLSFQVFPGAFSVGGITNVQAPYSPVLQGNASLIRTGIEGGLNFDASEVNSYLLASGNAAFTLPPAFNGMFPDGTIQIQSQSGGLAIPNESGYFELTGRCSCAGVAESDSVQVGTTTVIGCPSTVYSDVNFCPNNGRRRAQDEADPATATHSAGRRRTDAAVDNAALQQLLGEIYKLCVTNAPSHSPTPPTPPTRSPTAAPTAFPTWQPTPPTVLGAGNANCSETHGCYYLRNVLSFRCNSTAFSEVTACRVQNSDILCCPNSAPLGAGVSMWALCVVGFLAWTGGLAGW
jgi:hypothetical protein